jgi:integrase
MATRGRKQLPGLLWDAGAKQWYRRYDGRKKYFGQDEQDAKRRYVDYEVSLSMRQGLAEIAAELADTDRRLAQLTPAEQEQLKNAGVAEFAKLEEKLLNGKSNGNGKLIITAQDVVDVYLEDLKANASKQHQIDAKRRLKHWTKFIGKHKDIAELTPEDFLRYRKGLHKKFLQRKEWEAKQKPPISIAAKQNAPGIAGSSFNKHMVLVKGAFQRAALRKGWQLREHVRCLAQLEQVTANKQEVVIFSKSDVKAILNADEKVLDLKWKTLFLFALNMAGSNTDVAEATWGNVRFDKNTIEYIRQKNQQIRRFPLWKDTKDYLLKWQAVCPSVNYLFTTCHGNPFISVHGKKGMNRKDSLGQQFRIRMDKLKLSQSFNAVRKSVATIAAKNGANELTVKMLLGDAPNDVWKSYAQSMPETIKAAMTAVAKDLGIKA